jgi:hypothetical protein
LVAKNDGVVMVNFFRAYVSAARQQWEAERVAAKIRAATLPSEALFEAEVHR